MMQITELEVWKAAIDLAKSCYELSAGFPEEGSTGLKGILRRTVTNIPANVSAAASRKHGKESLRHLFRARDMIYELESHLYLAETLGLISNEDLEKMLDMLNTSKRLLFGFIKYYKRSGNHGRRRHDKKDRYNTDDGYYGNPDHDSESYSLDEQEAEAGVEEEDF